MKKPVLVIMAAGMGSRYGGLKQIDPVDEQGHIIMDFSMYDDVLFLSKSVGTAVASAYGGKHGLNTRNVYYTPVEASFQFMTQPGIAFTGTADSWVDYHVVQNGCEKGGFPLYVIDGADHSLEKGNVIEDLENLQEIMKKTEDYIKAFR